MFQFPGFPSICYGFTYGWLRFAQPGFPIQKSPDQWIFAPPRSLSQLVTSFIGSWCQGIPLALFIAWPSSARISYHSQWRSRHCALTSSRLLFPPQTSFAVETQKYWFSWIMQAINRISRNCNCTHIFSDVPQLKFTLPTLVERPLCCLAFITFFSLFSFQGAISGFCWNQIETFNPLNASIHSR